MKKERITIGSMPAILWGDAGDKAFLYVHGQAGSKNDAEGFAAVATANGWQVLSFDLPKHGERKDGPETFDPWHAVPELREAMAAARSRWQSIGLCANSIGAWFSMLAFADENLAQCLFVSPILDMKRLIENMMRWAGITEDRLNREKTIPTTFGQTLSWEYRTYAKDRPITRWDFQTKILYGGKDNLTERDVVEAFANRFGCELTVMEAGEHWFHTDEQLKALDGWTRAAFEPR